MRCRGGHICKLVHTLRIPLAPSWKKSGEPAIPIGNPKYLPQGKLIVQILDASGSNLMVSEPMLRSRAVAKVKPSSFCGTVLILGIGKGFLINLLLTSQKLLRKYGVIFYLWYYK